MPEDVNVGGGEGVVVESAPAQESAPVQESSASPGPSPQPGSSGGEWQAEVARLAEENRQFREYYQQQSEAQTKYQQEFQQNLLRALAPDFYKQQNQPKYVTADDFQKAIANQQQTMQRELEVRQEMATFQSELKVAEEKYGRVFSTFEDARDLIMDRWANSKKSVMEIAAALDKSIGKVFEKQQAEVVAGKKQMQDAIKGGGVKAGSAPNPAARDSGLRGRERLRAIRLRNS